MEPEPLLQREPLPHCGVWERGSSAPRAPTPHGAQQQGTRPTPTRMRPLAGPPGARGTREAVERERVRCRGKMEGDLGAAKPGAPAPWGTRGDAPGLAPGPSPRRPTASPGDTSAWKGEQTRDKQQHKRAPRTVPAELTGPLRPRGSPTPEGRGSPQLGRAATRGPDASARGAAPRAALLEPAGATPTRLSPEKNASPGGKWQGAPSSGPQGPMWGCEHDSLRRGGRKTEHGTELVPRKSSKKTLGGFGDFVFQNRHFFLTWHHSGSGQAPSLLTRT